MINSEEQKSNHFTEHFTELIKVLRAYVIRNKESKMVTERNRTRICTERARSVDANSI